MSFAPPSPMAATFPGFRRCAPAAACSGATPTGWRGSIYLHAFAQNDIAVIGETPTAGYNLLKAEISYKTKLDPAGSAPAK